MYQGIAKLKGVAGYPAITLSDDKKAAKVSHFTVNGRKASLFALMRLSVKALCAEGAKVIVSDGLKKASAEMFPVHFEIAFNLHDRTKPRDLTPIRVLSGNPIMLFVVSAQVISR